MEFRKKHIWYVGLSSEGLKPDYDKLKQVEKMKAPQSIKDYIIF